MVNKTPLDISDECEVVKALEHFNEDAFKDNSHKSTKLFELIEQQDWKLCSFRLGVQPHEASVWSFPEGHHGNDTQQRLPIHEVCRHRPPEGIVVSLINAFPQGVRSKDFSGRLPIHHACIFGASRDVIHLLLRTYPDSKEMKDNWGNTPLDALMATCNPDKDVVDLFGNSSSKPIEREVQPTSRSRDGLIYTHFSPHSRSPPVSTERENARMPTASQSFLPKLAASTLQLSDDGVESRMADKREEDVTSQQYASMRDDIETTEPSYETKERTYSGEKEHNEETLKFIANLKERLSKDRSNQLASVQSLQKDKSDLHGKLNELRAKYDSSMEEIADLKEVLDEKKHLGDEIIALRNKNLRLEMQLRQDAKEYDKDLEEMRYNLEKKEAKERLMEEDARGKDAMLQDREFLLSNFKEERERLMAEHAREMKEMDKLKEEHAVLIAAADEKKDLEDQMIALENENSRLVEEMREMERKTTVLKDSLYETEQDLKTSVDIITELKGALTGKEAPLVDKMSSIENDNQRLEEENEYLRICLSEKEQEAVSHKKIAEDRLILLDESTALKQTVSTQEKELISKEIQLEKGLSEIASLQDQMKEKENEMYERLSDLETATKVEIERQVCKNKDLESSLEKAQAEKSELIAKHNHMVNRLKVVVEKSGDSGAVDDLHSKMIILQRKIAWMEPRLTDQSKSVYERKTFTGETLAVSVIASQPEKAGSTPEPSVGIVESQDDGIDDTIHELEEGGESRLESRFLQWLDDKN